MAVNMLSERGNKIMLVDNYKIRFQKKLSNGTRWCCTKKDCSAFLKKDSSGEITEQKLVHNHPPDHENMLERQKVKNAVKRKATEDICARPRKIIHSELKNWDTDKLDVSDMSSVRRAIYNSRRAILPAQPQSIAEVHQYLETAEIKTGDGQDFLLLNDANQNLVIFSCYNNLSALCNAEMIFVDGTFKCSSKFFLQLFTIHAIINGYYVPLVFCLINNKLSETYEHLFRAVIDKCRQRNLVWSPRIIYADFEKGIHKALNRVWSEAEIKGCRFHLAQSWWRYIQKVRLTQTYREDTEQGKFLRHIFGLPLLDDKMVSEYFVDEIVATAPNDKRFIEFLDYLTETYISEEATFPPEVWAEMSSRPTRTTNACESFHAKFNASFYSPHPNIFIFLENIKNCQTETKLTLNSAAKRPKKVSAQMKKKIDFIDSKIHQLQAGEISISSYTAAVAYKNLPVY